MPLIREETKYHGLNCPCSLCNQTDDEKAPPRSDPLWNLADRAISQLDLLIPTATEFTTVTKDGRSYLLILTVVRREQP